MRMSLSCAVLWNGCGAFLNPRHTWSACQSACSNKCQPLPVGYKIVVWDHLTLQLGFEMLHIATIALPETSNHVAKNLLWVYYFVSTTKCTSAMCWIITQDTQHSAAYINLFYAHPWNWVTAELDVTATIVSTDICWHCEFFDQSQNGVKWTYL